MRVSSLNCDNLFDRPKVMDPADWSRGKETLELQADINGLLEAPDYTDAIKQQIVVLLNRLGLAKSDEGNAYATLRQDRGHLLTRTAGGPVITAPGRSAWIGHVELKTAPTDEIATENTARVIKDLDADIQVAVEVEDRMVLREFSDSLLPKVGGKAYPHLMVLEGNDMRAINVGILLKQGYELVSIVSHVDDVDGEGLVFSRDCPEYTVRTPGGVEIVVLPNHLKSQGYGSKKANDARRLRQARRVKEIYERLRNEGHPNVIVAGDCNDCPDSEALRPLIQETDLKDVSAHEDFQDGGLKGTYGDCGDKEKFDYVLLSPALFARVQGGGIYRMGAWGRNGKQWPHYANMATAVNAASDHCAIYADLAL